MSTPVVNPNPGADPSIGATPAIPSVGIGVQSAAQVPTDPNHKDPYASVLPADPLAFTADQYWAAQPDPVRVLRTVESQTQQSGTVNTFTPPTPAELLEWSMTLATKGFVIDFEIMALGNSPQVIMLLRQNMNIPSVPALLTGAPIKTSTRAANYPPYDPAPPVTPPPPAATVVGPLQGYIPSLGGVVYGAGAGALQAVQAGLVADGKEFTEGGVTYTAHVTAGLMGVTVWFTK